jgi:hypothetical protein
MVRSIYTLFRKIYIIIGGTTGRASPGAAPGSTTQSSNHFNIFQLLRGVSGGACLFALFL